MKVAIIYGEVHPDDSLDEQDVLNEVAAVAITLSELRYEPVLVPLTGLLTEDLEAIKKVNPIFCFNLVTSLQGQGKQVHLIPSLLASLRIPCTGSGTETLLLTNHKLLAKKILKNHNISTPEWFLPSEVTEEMLSSRQYLAKSIWEHASRGIHLADPSSEGKNKQILMSWFGKEWFLERYVEGREITFALLGQKGRPEILPPMEILFLDYPPSRPKILCFKSKWMETSFEFQHTVRNFHFAPPDRECLEKMKEISARIWDIFQISGYARIDFRVDEEKNPWVLEINTNCCLSPDSGFIAQAKEAGLDYPEVIQRIVLEIER